MIFLTELRVLTTETQNERNNLSDRTLHFVQFYQFTIKLIPLLLPIILTIILISRLNTGQSLYNLLIVHIDKEKQYLLR